MYSLANIQQIRMGADSYRTVMEHLQEDVRAASKAMKP
jgi:hypothetical protein